MKSIFNLIKETEQSLFSEYNYGKENAKELMPHCRFAIERFIFEKVVPQR